MEQSQAGFTFVELIIVLIIISILSIRVYIAWPATSINLGVQSEQLLDDIRYAQNLAMTKGQRYRWVKTSSTTYQITNSSGTPIAFAKGNSTQTLNSGITFGTLTNLPNNLIAFDGQGTPYTDTALPGTPLASIATISITAGGITETISISPETGRAVGS